MSFPTPEQVFPDGTPYEQAMRALTDLVTRHLPQAPCRLDITEYPSDAVAQVRNQLEQAGWIAHTEYSPPGASTFSVHLDITPRNRRNPGTGPRRPLPPFPGPLEV